MDRKSGALTGIGTLLTALVVFADQVPPTETVRQQSSARCAEFLIANQNDEGSWSDAKYPALTAFALIGLNGGDHPNAKAAIARAVDFLIDAQVDGGMYEGAIYVPAFGEKGSGLPNYNTAVSIAALAGVDDPRVTPVILKARGFLARSQYLGSKDSLFSGGMGYDPPAQRAYADMSNSYLGYEGMHLTRRFEDMRPRSHGKVDLNWKSAIGFLVRCQNDSDINALPWASSDESEKGGFAYRPDEFRPTSGAYTNSQGVLKYRTMPGMTYAGLLSYRYAGVSAKDPRVVAAFEWARKNWQLERGNRNPDVAGTDKEGEGLFYMYCVMSKALSAYGVDTITVTDGTPVNWRDALVGKLAATQNADGSWINEMSRYWEGNPILASSYALIALNHAAPAQSN